MSRGLKRFFRALLVLTLAACSQGTLRPASFPKSNRPELRKIVLADCLKIKGYKKPVCLPNDSPWSFVQTVPLLLNDEDLKNYIELLESAPFWE